MEVVEDSLVLVLGGEAGICQETIDVAPLTQAAIVKQFKVISDDEWYDAVCQTLLEHQQAAYTSVTVLKRMNLLEAYMEIEDVF